MIKIHYPKDVEKLKSDYLKLFDLETMKRRWAPVEKKHQITIENLLVGDFPFLAEKYLWFKSQNVSERQKRIYSSIFDYDAMQPKIAEFFMNPTNGLELSTCHYCNMAYINTYSKALSYTDALDFVNRATIAEWREVFDSDKLSDMDLLEAIANRSYVSLENFNKKKYLKKKIELYKGFSLNVPHNHFDLDHLLPKSICPIVGLSLFNFVPSCQVCNEKLKKAKELADTRDGWLKISPTFQGSAFDDNVPIKLVPLEHCSTFFDLQRNNGNYRLEFQTNGDNEYEKYVSLFKLQDRYNYHKNLALHVLDLKERYPIEKRKEISRLLSAQETDSGSARYSEAQIEIDILQEEFNQDRCFAKLRRDMIHKN